MRLNDLIGLLVRRWVLIVLTVVIFSLAGVVLSRQTTPEYSSTASVVVTIEDSRVGSGGLGPVKFELARIPEYASFAQTKSFLQRVVEAHRLGISSEQLSESLSVSSPKDTALIRIAVKSSSSAAAADRANAVAEELARTIPEREELLPVRATVAEDAFPATLPKRPLPTREIAEFAVIGATVGVALAITFSGRRERRRVDLSSESVREQRGGSYGTHAKA